MGLGEYERLKEGAMFYLASLIEDMYPFVALLGLNIFMFYMIRHIIREKKNE